MPLTPADDTNETVTLDPSEVAIGRTALDITPWIAQDGVNWGDAALVAYASEQAVGSTVVDYRIPNRQVTIPLVIRERGAFSFEVARREIQAKAALMQAQGGWLKRVVSTGGTVFADVVNASLTLGGDWLQAHSRHRRQRLADPRDRSPTSTATRRRSPTTPRRRCPRSPSPRRPPPPATSRSATGCGWWSTRTTPRTSAG